MTSPGRRKGLIAAATVFAALAATAAAQAQTGTVGTQFTTASLAQSGFIPPDTMGAIGLNHFVAIVNGRIAVFDKAGALVTANSDSSFFANLGQSGAAGDPRILYDPMARRWFAINFTGSATNNRILIARTNGTDPSNLVSNWQATGFNTGLTTKFADFPTLGLDANGLYVGTNDFGGTFTTSIYSIPKADIVQSVPTVANRANFQNLSASGANERGFTQQGVVNLEAKTTASPAPVISVSNVAFSRLKGSFVNGSSAAGATLSPSAGNAGITIPVATTNVTGFPSTVTSFGGVNLEAGDDRFSGNVVQVGNRIFGVHMNIPGAGVPAQIRLTVLDATSPTLNVLSETTISNASTSFIYPSIAVNPAGDIVIGMSGVGSAAANAAYAVVGTIDGANALTFGTPFVTQAGSGTYNLSGSGRVRWGDYSSTNVDPTDPGIFWTHQEYTSSANNWSTVATEVVPTKANEIRWRPRTSGALTTASNYFTGVAPGASDHVIFSRGAATYTVNTMAGVTNDRASVRQGNVTWDATGGTYTLANGNAATPSLAVGDYQGTTTLTMSAGNFSTVNTTIGSGFGGSGTVVLGAAATWANSGTVYVGGNSAGSRGGTGVLRVDAGATLSGGGVRVWAGGTVQGTGTITAPITVSGAAIPNIYIDGSTTGTGTTQLAINSVAAAPATISPGNSVGTINTGQVNINTGGRYLWEISSAGVGGVGLNTGASGGVKDLIAATGDLNFFDMEIAITGLGGTGFNNLQTYSWIIGTTTGAISITGTNVFSPNAEFAAAGGNVYSFGAIGGVLYLNYNPVPEPATILAACAVVGGAVGLWRRRRRGRSERSSST